MAGADGFSVTINPQEWYRLKRELDSFDPELARALRKRIRNAGNIAADEVKRTLRLPSPESGDATGEGRAALIAATKVSVSFGRKTAGAKIVTGSRRLAEKHKGLVHVYNKSEFRHPVFGQDVWVRQKGRPYFESSIQKVLNRAVLREVEEALDDAMKAIGARGV